MKFFGTKRSIPVDRSYSQIQELGQFWDEMRKLYPNDFLYGLGTNWTDIEFDYYIGKIDETWLGSTETIDIPDSDWHEFSCKDDDEEIEQMYRQVYEQGTPNYEIESMKDGVFTTKVHFKSNKEK